MVKYHINPTTGEVNLCRADTTCPFGGEDLHFRSEEDARKAYEIKMSELTLPELIQRSSQRSEWRQKDWETERKPYVEKLVLERANEFPKLQKYSIRFQWVEKVNESHRTLGYTDIKRKIVTFYLSEDSELLEKTGLQKLVIHELSHVLEEEIKPIFKGKEDHATSWEKATEIISSGINSLEGLSVPKYSQYTPEEKVRRETAIIGRNLPMYAGVCANKHYSFSSDPPNVNLACDGCLEETYSLDSKPQWDLTKNNDEAKDYFIYTRLETLGFGKQ